MPELLGKVLAFADYTSKNALVDFFYSANLTILGYVTEVLACARMTSVVGGKEIPAFAGILMLYRMINDLDLLLINYHYIFRCLQFLGMKDYYVYMHTNTYHNVLYIGFTNNIRRRVYEHKRKLVYGFTSKYNYTKLVWYETFTDVNLAIVREKQLKT